jgi:hypothetical protein
LIVAVPVVITDFVGTSQVKRICSHYFIIAKGLFVGAEVQSSPSLSTCVGAHLT